MTDPNCPMYLDRAVSKIRELEAELKAKKFDYMGAMEDCKELEAELTALREELKETEEKCQFWCDEARKLGYKEK